MLKSDITKEQILTALNVARKRIVELEALNTKLCEKLDLITSPIISELKNDITSHEKFKEEEILYKTLLNIMIFLYIFLILYNQIKKELY